MLYARDIMTTEVLTVSPETSIADLSKTLENRQIGGVPVVDKGGRLVGIITQSDLVERARDLELPRPSISWISTFTSRFPRIHSTRWKRCWGPRWVIV